MVEFWGSLILAIFWLELATVFYIHPSDLAFFFDGKSFPVWSMLPSKAGPALAGRGQKDDRYDNSTSCSTSCSTCGKLSDLQKKTRCFGLVLFWLEHFVKNNLTFYYLVTVYKFCLFWSCFFFLIPLALLKTSLMFFLFSHLCVLSLSFFVVKDQSIDL